MNNFNWSAFVDVWEEYLDFMDRLFAWLKYVLANGEKPVVNE